MKTFINGEWLSLGHIGPTDGSVVRLDIVNRLIIARRVCMVLANLWSTNRMGNNALTSVIFTATRSAYGLVEISSIRFVSLLKAGSQIFVLQKAQQTGSQRPDLGHDQPCRKSELEDFDGSVHVQWCPCGHGKFLNQIQHVEKH